MEHAAIYACDGCSRHSFELRVVDGGAKLCGSCAETSARIDRLLATTRSEDPVSCDGCGEDVDFDARVAAVARECGGAVFCDRCKPTAAQGASS